MWEPAECIGSFTLEARVSEPSLQSVPKLCRPEGSQEELGLGLRTLVF